MSRLFPWQIVVPRLLFVVVLVLAAQFTLGRLARWITVSSLETALNSSVELANARFSVVDRQLVLGGLQLRAGDKSSCTMLEADCCALDFATPPLLHKKAVVEHGLLTGLRFAVANPAAAMSTKPVSQAPKSFEWAGCESDQAAQRWFERLDRSFSAEFPHQFESLEQTEKLCARWPQEAAALNERIHELKTRAANLQQTAEAAQLNPLRNIEFLRQLPDDVATLRADFALANVEIERLSDSLETNRRAIVAARRRDEQRLHNELRMEPLDAAALTTYLLREQVTPPLDEAITTLRWVRQMVPAKQPRPTSPTRGSNVYFDCCQRSPSVCIRNLHLQGTARLGGQPVELCGMLNDFTNAPAWHVRPIRLQMKAVGSLPLTLKATIDRTRRIPRDELLVDCRGMMMPPKGLGKTGGFTLRQAPSNASLAINLLVVGDKLTGEIQLSEKHVQFTPVFSGELANAPLAAALQLALAGVDSHTVRVAVSGTLDRPTCTLESSLGPAVAEAVDRAALRAGNEQARVLMARVQQRVDERLAGLERQSQAQQTKLVAQMSDATCELQRVATQHLPASRLSSDQLGQLPADSLFR